MKLVGFLAKALHVNWFDAKTRFLLSVSLRCGVSVLRRLTARPAPVGLPGGSVIVFFFEPDSSRQARHMHEGGDGGDS